MTLGWEDGELFLDRYNFPLTVDSVGTVYGISGIPQSCRVYKVMRPVPAPRWGYLRDKIASEQQTDLGQISGTGDTAWLPLRPITYTGVAASSLPLLFIALSAKHHRRPGHCPSCGYDLRGTPNRCPECGQFSRSHSTALNDPSAGRPK